MRSTITTTVRGVQNPFVAAPALGGAATGISGSGGAKKIFNAFIRVLEKILFGGLASRREQRPKVYASTANAVGTVTCATVLATNTVTLNGTALTAVTGAASNNQFDRSGTDTATATNLAAAINASTTSLVSGHVVANNIYATVTCASVAVGDWVNLAGEKLFAIAGTTDSGGNRVTTVPPNLWSQASTDTNDGVSLANCINAHPTLRELYYASAASGVVTIFERSPTLGGLSYLETSSGTTLAVANTTGGVMQAGPIVLLEAVNSGVTGNAITLASSGATLTVSGSRFTGGTSTTFTF